MTDSPPATEPIWYSRPVFFVTDIRRAVEFYVNSLDFIKKWHEGDGAGTVCQVDRHGCEIILCEDRTRNDRSRVFIELTPKDHGVLRGELARKNIPWKRTRWGYDTVQVDDPDGNELFFPIDDTMISEV